jgi:integrase
LFRYNGKDYVFGSKTKLEVEKAYWTKQHNKKSKDIEITNKQTEINNELNKIENHLLGAFTDVAAPDRINKDWVKTQIDYYYDPPGKEKNIPTNLIHYIDFYIDYRKHEVKKASLTKFKVIKHKLQKLEKFKKKQILISEVNDNFKNEFISYCKSELYSQNTIQKELAIIKTFCKHARFLGLETHSQLDSLRSDKEKVEKIYLTFEDLSRIEHININELTDSLDNAKDWLIISCYSGQRISDFMRFTDKQIRIEDGKHLLEFTQMKTSKLTTIPIHPKILEILKKRNGKFPYRISDQKYNDYVKEVCKLAGLNELVKGSKMLETKIGSKTFRKQEGLYKKYELVTSHIGRRSFATNFYGEIPTTYLINITNHSSEAMFLNYIGKSNKDLAKETFKYF